VHRLDHERQVGHVPTWVSAGQKYGGMGVNGAAVDILSQRKSDGALELWCNDYNALTRTYTFIPMGLAAETVEPMLPAWRRTDASRAGSTRRRRRGMENIGQAKHSEGWDRANMRFADVENGEKADLVWINKYNGEVTVLKKVAASGSSFTWEKRGVLYASVDERATADVDAVAHLYEKIQSWYHGNEDLVR